MTTEFRRRSRNSSTNNPLHFYVSNSTKIKNNKTFPRVSFSNKFFSKFIKFSKNFIFRLIKGFLHNLIMLRVSFKSNYQASSSSEVLSFRENKLFTFPASFSILFESSNYFETCIFIIFTFLLVLSC